MKEIEKLFNFSNYKNRVALISENEEVTYSQINEKASEIEKLIGDRCLVFLICTNTIDSIISYLSILKSGSACLLVADIDISELVEKYKPRFIFSPKEKKLSGRIVKELNSYSLIKTNYETSYKISENLAILLTTSGSTGSPKFVRISYDNIINNTNSITEYLKIDNSHKAITTMPMSYTYGLSIINTHLNKGASLVVTEASLLSREFWSLLKDKNVTNFGGVPYTYEILKKLRFERMELPSLKYITQAGGKLKKNLVLEFYENCIKKDINFIVMYGQTEATSRMSYLPSTNIPSKPGSIGIAIPNGKFHLIDESGHEIKESFQSGELIFEGKNVSLGYSISFDDLKNEDENKGLLHTGDLAHVDEDGFYFIVGRKKRFVKIYGNRVNLDEFENIIKEYGYSCACTGEDDNITIHMVDDVDTVELFNKIMKDTTLNKNAFTLCKIDEIPRSDSGKILYSKLKK